jgi:hypothetical protein
VVHPPCPGRVPERSPAHNTVGNDQLSSRHAGKDSRMGSGTPPATGDGDAEGVGAAVWEAKGVADTSGEGSGDAGADTEADGEADSPVEREWGR